MAETRNQCSRCGDNLVDRPASTVEVRTPFVTVMVLCPPCVDSLDRWRNALKAEPALAPR